MHLAAKNGNKRLIFEPEDADYEQESVRVLENYAQHNGLIQYSSGDLIKVTVKNAFKFMIDFLFIILYSNIKSRFSKSRLDIIREMQKVNKLPFRYLLLLLLFLLGIGI